MTVLGSRLRKMRLPHNTSWRRPMTCTDFPHPAPTTARSDDSILFAALELSRKSWLVATSAPGEEKVSKRTVSAGDGRALLAGLREKADRQAGQGRRDPGSRARWLLAAPPAGSQRDRKPRRGSRLDRGGLAQAAAQDRLHRRRRAAAHADGLGARRTPGLFDGPAAQPGRGGGAPKLAGVCRGNARRW